MSSFEIETKIERVRALIKSKGLGGIYMKTRPHFAWITEGGRNGINEASDLGAGGILITADNAYLVANNIETRRLMEEECCETNFEVAEYPWYEAGAEAAVIQKLLGGKPVGVDFAGEGVNISPELFAAHTPLLATEKGRYRELGKLTAKELEAACRGIQSGMIEQTVACLVTQRFMAKNARVPVCLVGSDKRLELRRHPLPTNKVINDIFMVVVCVESGGLVCSASRVVSFEPVSDELKAKHRAVCEVDVAAMAATLPGRSLAEVFAVITCEYDKQGYADEWRHHHQGGLTGYRPRVTVANAQSDHIIRADEAYAWNPTIAGTKCEDTILTTNNGIEMLTQPGENWPVIEIECADRVYKRADILV